VTIVRSGGIIRLNHAECEGEVLLHSDVYPQVGGPFVNVVFWTADHPPSWYAYGVASSIEGAQDEVEAAFCAGLIAFGYAKPTDDPAHIYRSNKAVFDLDLHVQTRKVPHA
jgi:hypothetical protein